MSIACQNWFWWLLHILTYWGIINPILQMTTEAQRAWQLASKWPQMLPASWLSHFPAFTSHIWTWMTIKLCQRWQVVTAKITLKKVLWLLSWSLVHILSFLQITYRPLVLGEAICHVTNNSILQTGSRGQEMIETCCQCPRPWTWEPIHQPQLSLRMTASPVNSVIAASGDPGLEPPS